MPKFYTIHRMFVFDRGRITDGHIKKWKSVEAVCGAVDSVGHLDWEGVTCPECLALRDVLDNDEDDN